MTQSPGPRSVSPDPQDALARARSAEQEIAKVVRGNPRAVRLLLSSIFAGGHTLIEDVPGVGKTTLARTCAKVLGCGFSRIQFTADLLPADVTGGQILDPKTGTFHFRRGPIFSEIVLADEINRASPKTQSALLEAMADGQVTVDETSHVLPRPFCVIATQNPIEHHGAYPLPESQLDRFLVRLTLGYPPVDDERALLLNPHGAESALIASEVLLDPSAVLQLQERARQVGMAPAIADYILAIAEATRSRSEVVLGVSPRGTLAFAALCRTWAMLDGRDFITPDDVKHLAPDVMSHRMMLRDGGVARASEVVHTILDEVAVPR